MEVVNALGRRKSAIARIFVSEGTGKITINKRDLAEYFPSSILQYVVKQPLNKLGVAEKYDIKLISRGLRFTWPVSGFAFGNCPRTGENQC